MRSIAQTVQRSQRAPRFFVGKLCPLIWREIAPMDGPNRFEIENLAYHARLLLDLAAPGERSA
ncbi:MAG: hypothetical protein WBP72_18885 [Rhodocyclaceae bacterium]